MRAQGLAVILLAIFLAVGTLQWSGAVNGTYGSSPGGETPQEAQTAGALVEKLNAVANFTEGVMASAHSQQSPGYASAKAYRVRALEEYHSKDYPSAIADALRAMHYYRAVLSQLNGTDTPPGENARAKLVRMGYYLKSVGRLIQFAGSLGLNVSNITEAYNQTVVAYKKVWKDLRGGNFNGLPADLRTLETKRALLEEALVPLRGSLMDEASVKIVEGFITRGGSAINLARNIVDTASQHGIDTKMLQVQLVAFERVYGQVLKLKSAGDYKGALRVIQTNRRVITSFQTSIMYVRLRLGVVGKGGTTADVGTLINETRGRILTDRLSLERLKEMGANTRIAELQLMTAVREFNAAVMFYQRDQRVEAMKHFLAARFLLNRVEYFIRAHSSNGG